MEIGTLNQRVIFLENRVVTDEIGNHTRIELDLDIVKLEVLGRHQLVAASSVGMNVETQLVDAAEQVLVIKFGSNLNRCHHL